MSLKDTTKVVLKSLVLSSPEPLTIDQLERDYKEQEGQCIPYSKLGHANLKSFLLSMPDVLAYNTVKRTFTVATSETGKSDHIHKLVSGQKTDRRKTRNSKPFNHPNYSNHNNGQNRERQALTIWDQHPLNHNQSLFNYSQNYGQPSIHQPNYVVTPTYQARPFEPGNLLSAPSYNRSSLLGMPQLPSLVTMNVPRPLAPAYQPPHLRHVASNGRPNNNNKPKHDTAKKNASSNSSSLTSAEPTDNKKLNGDADTSDENIDSNPREIGALPPIDDDDPIYYIGSKLMSSKYGRKIPLATMPKNLKSGHTQQIYVTEITNFPYFYFQFAGTDEIMRGLQEELNLTYDDYGERSDEIRRSEIQIGTVCAAYHGNKWSRAEILAKANRGLRLLFVDYGMTYNVPMKKTRYLNADMCEIPRLCHRGALAFVEPLQDDQVENKVIAKFCELVADKSLMAVFSNVDESDDISMTLVDTSDSKDDVIVNKILMEEIFEYKSDDELDRT